MRPNQTTPRNQFWREKWFLTGIKVGREIRREIRLYIHDPDIMHQTPLTHEHTDTHILLWVSIHNKI